MRFPSDIATHYTVSDRDAQGLRRIPYMIYAAFPLRTPFMARSIVNDILLDTPAPLE